METGERPLADVQRCAAAALRAPSVETVLVIGVLPETSPREPVPGRVEELNRGLESLALSLGERVRFLDTHRAPLVDPKSGLLETSMARDRLHLNEPGYAVSRAGSGTCSPSSGLTRPAGPQRPPKLRNRSAWPPSSADRFGTRGPPTVLRSISSNWALNAIQILVFMVLTPFAANALGRDLYGVWEVLVATAGPLQMLALGLPMATVRAVSAGRSSEEDPDAASRALGTSLSMTLVLGAVAAALGGALWVAFDALLVGSPEWSGIGDAGARDARAALTVLLVNVAAGFALKLPYAVYDAHGDFVARNLIMGGGLLLKLGATVGFLTLYPDLFTLAWIQLGIAALEFALAFGVSRRRHPEVRFAPRRIRWCEAKGLLSFSIFAFLLNMGALLAFRLDALVIGAHMAPEKAAIYGFGNKIFDPFIQLILGIGMVLMPMAASRANSRATSPRSRTRSSSGRRSRPPSCSWWAAT